MVEMRRLEERVVIVNGGGSGIGKGACERIAEEGGFVSILDIRDNLAAAVADQINNTGGKTISIGCDVADESQVADAIAKIE